MSTANNNQSYEDAPDEVIQTILQSHFGDKNSLMGGYIIVVNNRIFYNGVGKWIFKSREEAVQSFYNTLSWPVKRLMLRNEYPNARSIWSNEYKGYRKVAWIRFKATLKNKYNFDIVRL